MGGTHEKEITHRRACVGAHGGSRLPRGICACLGGRGSGRGRSRDRRCGAPSGLDGRRSQRGAAPPQKVGLLFGLRRRHLRLGDEEGGHLLSEEERTHGGRRRGQGDVQGARHDRFLQRARKRRLFGRGEFVRSLSSRQDHLRRRPRRTLHGAGGDRRGHSEPREKFVLPQHGGGRRLSAGGVHGGLGRADQFGAQSDGLQRRAGCAQRLGPFLREPLLL